MHLLYIMDMHHTLIYHIWISHAHGVQCIVTYKFNV